MPEETWAAENTLSFGQCLPLLPLIQPVAAIVVHFAGKQKGSTRSSTTGPHEPLVPPRPIAYDTLADTLCHGQLLTRNEKLAHHYDPVKHHLLSSRTYRALLWLTYVDLVASGLTFIVLASIFGLLYALIYALIAVGTVGWIPVMVLVCLPCSRKLR